MKKQVNREPLLKRIAWRRCPQYSAVLNLGVIFWGAWWLASGVAMATDWTQFQGPNMDGTTPDPIALQWDTSSPSFVVWTNLSLTNGFSSFAVSKGGLSPKFPKGALVWSIASRLMLRPVPISGLSQSTPRRGVQLQPPPAGTAEPPATGEMDLVPRRRFWAIRSMPFPARISTWFAAASPMARSSGATTWRQSLERLPSVGKTELRPGSTETSSLST